MTSAEQIILIDDEEAWRQQMGADLVGAFPKLKVFCFACEADARHYMDENQPHGISMVIADAVLGPLERGADLLRYCGTRVPHAKRVLMSNKATRDDLEFAINEARLDAYIEKRDSLTAENIQLLKGLLSFDRVTSPINDREAAKLRMQLSHIPVGEKRYANLFKNSIKDLIAYCLYPWLIGPKTEVHILDGAKAIDILFHNATNDGILSDIKTRYGALTIPIETKNTLDITSRDFDQLARYLTPAVGRCGILCFRGKTQSRHIKQAKALQRDEKFVLILEDDELLQFCGLRLSGTISDQSYSDRIEDLIRKKHVDTF